MSEKRLICLNLTDFRPVGESIGTYETNLGQDLHYLVLNGNFNNIDVFTDQSQTMKMAYCSSRGQWIHRYVELSSDQSIIESQELELHFTRSKQHQEIVFNFKKTEANLPHNYHFAAGINEIMKQVTHAGQWFRKEYTTKQ
jgi:hypothetical protein